MLQLRCLPQPFTPANGFSWSRQARPYFGATRCIVSIVIIWWSVATLAFSKIGRHLVLARRDFVVPGLHRHADLVELHLDIVHERLDTRSGIAPKY